jgi:Translation initiation factor IF-2, N-terminal region.
MNNGKVRIYELSRELNLDNKDILAVCERLNISVKSHSSTITESEAERIRKTAEKYVASSHSSPGKPAPPERAAAPSRESGPHPNDQQKKQQILEIRSPKVRPAGALPACGQRGAKNPAWGHRGNSSKIARRSTTPASS